MSAGKKALSGFLSSLAWVVLALCLLSTTANLVIGGLSNIGGSASAIVKAVSSNPTTLNSLIDEIEKSADPKAAKEIEKNRAVIEETLASLGESDSFRQSLEKTLNEISAAVLSGSDSVKVDFSEIANRVAKEVNSAAKTTVITKKDLESVVPTTLDLSKQSDSITQVKKIVKLSLLLWLLWLALLALVFWIKGKRVLQTSGIQLLSIGALSVIAHFATPLGIKAAADNSDATDFQREVITQVFKALSSPALTIGLIATGLGVVLIVVARSTPKNKVEIEPQATI